jgi:pimeloyl-ACP methyl ester carboxylesterase/DNA-binding winged helix-turn-helix (wHTH) protein
MIFAFSDYELDLSLFELRHCGQVVAMEPQVFDVLAHLVRNHDRVVPKEELLDQVWGDRFVSESALTSRIKAARKAVGDDGTSQHTIRTVHGRGYRFVADLETRESDAQVGAGRATRLDSPPAHATQDIRFCTTRDGHQLAYATIGEGPPLVKAANWLSNLEYECESPIWRHWIQGLSRRHHFVRYDERGCGLSDWDVDEFSLDVWVDDLETVVDTLGLDRFPLLGISQGGPVAIEYAVRHPERVSHLLLYGAYAEGPAKRARTPEERAESDIQLELVRLGWGRDDPAFRRVFAMQFMPDGTRALWDAFAELQRRTTSPENAVRFFEAFRQIDVRDRATQVRVPTLILHCRADGRVPPGQGRLLAGLIPDSRFTSLDSCNHILLEDDPAWPQFLDEIERFVGTVP